MSLRPIVLFECLLEDLAKVSTYAALIHGHYVNPFDGDKYFSAQSAEYLRTSTSVSEHVCAALIGSFLKKFQDGSLQAANSVALDKFLASNMQCEKWKLEDDRSLEDDLLLGLIKHELYRFFYRNSHGHILGDIAEIFHKGNVGPGASIGARGTDFYTKLFSSPLTASSSALYSLYEHHSQNIPFWRDGEKLRSDHYGDVSVVRGNRLSFVPKNVNASRCICTEPSLNMFFQKGVQAILEKRLIEYFGIDLATQQECNKTLAQIGSRNYEAFDGNVEGFTANYCTIDLSSASDTVSLKMVKALFPKEVTSWLELLRSPEVQLPDGSWKELHMISSMGNAYTFPLQTIIFSCVVSAVYQAQEIALRKGYGSNCKYDPETGGFRSGIRLPNFGVNGDDIIVVRRAYRQTVRALQLLGFTVNAEKSFSEGPFRESCGGDYYRGHPIRGVYLKSLKTQAARYVAINRLNAWSAEHGIALPKTISYLINRVRFLPVPLHENDDAGIKVPLSIVNHLKRDKDTGAIMYTRWHSVTRSMKIKDGALYVPGKNKKRLYNADGLLLAALRGDVRGFCLGSRLGAGTYRPNRALTPNWDWVPPVQHTRSYDQLLSKWRLADAIRTNILSS